MRHPNILSVTDFGRTPNGLTFLVMEYVRGCNLHDRISLYAPLALSEVAHLVEQVAAGLGEAHRLGFVHRDVKPANVMVGEQDGAPYVKILDFGIVGLRTEAFDTRLTGTGFIIGTPAYMAPEQARDPSFVTPAADFYSLGVMMFEMLTGRVPFDAQQPVDMIIKHSIEPVPPVPPSCGLELLVHWMLEKNPNDRPQSAEELLAELARLRATVPDDDTKPGFAQQDDTMEMLVDEIGEAKDQLLRAIETERPAAPRPPPQTFELPLLSPVTYQGIEPVLQYEGLRDRLDRIHETLIGSEQIESDVRQTFETRLAEMIAAVRPGLREYRYVDLATKIADLEREIWSRMRLRPA